MNNNNNSLIFNVTITGEGLGTDDRVNLYVLRQVLNLFQSMIDEAYKISNQSHKSFNRSTPKWNGTKDVYLENISHGSLHFDLVIIDEGIRIFLIPILISVISNVISDNLKDRKEIKKLHNKKQQLEKTNNITININIDNLTINNGVDQHEK